MTSYRLENGGSGIDRTKPVQFRFDGQLLYGFEGDTLASALLANGETLIGRSFKYHRPRGVYSAGSEEPNAMVTVGKGGRSEPNAKAPMVPLEDGLEAFAQNAWPSRKLDLLSVNSLLSPVFGAGFYYKTFMGGPQGTWTKVFEPIIRKAAGMGAASMEADPDRYETVNRFCDVLIVGGGPSGLMAALTAAETGCRVILADEGTVLGGALLHDASRIDGEQADRYTAALAERLAGYPNVQILNRTSIYGHYDGTVAGVQHVARETDAPGALPRQRHWVIRPRRVIIAAGAMERPVVFPGNDIPGVMLADAARAYVNRYGVAPGRTVAVFAAHDGAYRTVRDLANAGITVAAVIDPRHAVSEDCQRIVEASGAQHYLGHVVAEARGGKALRKISLAPVADGIPGRISVTLAVDALAVSASYTPTIHLTAQGGHKPAWDETLQAFLPPQLPDGWGVAGAMCGTYGLKDCLEAGRATGAEAVRALGLSANAPELPQVEDDLLGDTPHPLFEVSKKATGAKGKAFVDMQHDVGADDVTLASREGFQAVEHLKRYTTLGMATDQGKTSNVNGLALMAQSRSISVPQAGTTRFRPPFVPIALGALAGDAAGKEVRPKRRSPMHDWHVANGAEWIAAGLWLRPRAYLRPGEDIEAAYIREATAVRASVGVVDVSTLGKIEVAGPDAAELLNRLYVNAWLKLPVGKARYGIMLREDGFVFDDGTVWRLEENRVLMTTTTANAARVLSHIEFLLSTAWTDLKVMVASVTDQWAGMAVAGPNSRKTLAAAISDIDFSNDAFPFMAIRHGTMGGVPVTVTRLSFSGELAYEVYCGAHHGTGVWKAVMAAGAPYDIVPYGSEALGTLRIEKGHVSGPELDGRTTVHDLGFAGFASKKKAYVGRALMEREALTDPGRLRLVGLVSANGKEIRAGSHLVGGDEARSQGHVSSATYSPALGKYIALAMIERGPDRLGEQMTASYPLKNEAVPVELVDPCFFDPDGSRMNV